MSESPRLFEQISERLLDQDGDFTLTIVDGSGKIVRELPVTLDNPFQFNFKDYVPTKDVLLIEDFFDIAADLIQHAQKSDGVIESEQVKLVEAFPDELMRRLSNGEELISYEIRSRKPANMSVDASSRPQRGARFSYDIRSPEHPGKSIEVSARPVDHTIVFSCWSRTARQADRRALWLERLFETHKWAFLVQGADRFHWQRRGPDTYWGPHNQRVFQRPLEYFLRLSELEVKANPLLKQIAIEISQIDEVT